ncbi:MAG: endolytic transglycosylase MltG [Frankiales bacterium]|nr:endolytic transglycosylase MltG [Frankiales bacterium]
MTDPLNLGLDPAGHRAPAPSYRRRRIAVGLLAAAATAIVVAIVITFFSTVRGWFGPPADYSGPGSGSVVVAVHQGDSLTAIGQTLVHDGVVRSVGAFTDAANGTTAIGPGLYRLRHQMKASLAVSLLLDPKSLVQSRVTIPEGRRLRDILSTIAQNTQISLSSLQAAAKQPQALGVPSWGSGHPLEGFLFPATYNIAPGTTATQALRAMVARFNEAAAQDGLVSGARQLGYSPYQVLTIASIIEREGRLTTDFAKIAEVFYNRLQKQMPLGSDATLFYVLPPNHGPLTQSDLSLNSPYNTRTHQGLPPTPIASPGDAAITAALHPAHGPYLYFVTIDKAGHAAFATTLQKFNELVAQSRNNGVQ